LFFFSSRRRHTRFSRDWSSDVCSSDLKCANHTTQYTTEMGRCCYAGTASSSSPSFITATNGNTASINNATLGKYHTTGNPNHTWRCINDTASYTKHATDGDAINAKYGSTATGCYSHTTSYASEYANSDATL